MFSVPETYTVHVIMPAGMSCTALPSNIYLETFHNMFFFSRHHVFK